MGGAGHGRCSSGPDPNGSPSRGASGPNAFDCCGLVMWAFGQAGVGLPHSSQALAQGGCRCHGSDATGDLIQYHADASHAGLHRRRNDGACSPMAHRRQSPGWTCARSSTSAVTDRRRLGLLLLVELVAAAVLITHPFARRVPPRGRRRHPRVARRADHPNGPTHADRRPHGLAGSAGGSADGGPRGSDLGRTRRCRGCRHVVLG